MAEQREDAPYKIDAYNPFFTERKYLPFYKRYSFISGNNIVPSNQVANLVTSPSFTEFWSGGASQADNTSLIRVKNASRDANSLRLSQSGKYNVDFKPTPNPFPARPTPPAGIRPIKWVNNLPELFDPSLLGMSPEQVWHEGGFRPDKFADLWPQLSAEEQAWWDEAIRGKGGYNSKYLKHGTIEGANSNVPSILQNKAGALTRADRLRLASMVYLAPDTGFERWVNASSPQNLIGVSRELSESGMGSRSDFKPQNSTLRARRTLPIQLLTTTNPDVATSVVPSMRLLDEYQLQRLMEGAIDNHHIENFDKPKYYDPRKVKLPLVNGNTTPFLDVPKQEVPAVGIPSDVQRAEMQAGNVRTVGYMKPHGNGGVETVVYGPPTKGMAAEVLAGNMIHYGGKTLGLVGATTEGISVPWRKYQFINKDRELAGLPPISEPFDINKYPAGTTLSENVKGQILATGEAGFNFISMGIYDHYAYPELRKPMEPVQRGYYSDAGQKVPNWVPNLQSTYQDRPRYERQGVQFNHLYPKATY